MFAISHQCSIPGTRVPEWTLGGKQLSRNFQFFHFQLIKSGNGDDNDKKDEYLVWCIVDCKDQFNDDKISFVVATLEKGKLFPAT